jgi:uncharacterized repeat protein (TIGR01451 family)
MGKLVVGIAIAATLLAVGFATLKARREPFKPDNRVAAGLTTASAQPASLERNDSGSLRRSSFSSSHGRLPISFELNMGQADPQVKFTARGKGYSVLLTEDGAILGLQGARETSKPDNFKATSSGKSSNMRIAGYAIAVHLKLLRSNRKAGMTGTRKLPGVSNYYLGNDPRRWRTNVPTYEQVRCNDVYPGIDLLYYGNQGRLEHDFVVSPGADPERIAFELQGGEKARITPSGDLALVTSEGELSLLVPTVYQAAGARRTTIEAHYEVANDNAIHFRVGSYDHNQPLVIDPVLQYSTLLGGSSLDGGIYLHGGDNPPLGQGIAVDSAGEAVVVGETFSTNFPMKDAIDPTFGQVAGNRWVAFVTKMNSSGSALIYSTYLGGNSPTSGVPANSSAAGVAIDSAGDTYITGMTGAKDFPIANAFQSIQAGQEDAFVTKLSPSGSLIYSTFLGGSNEDESNAIAVDSRGEAFITGSTGGGFPTTTNSFNPSFGVGIFVAALDATGSNLLYSGILGTDQTSIGYGIAVDAEGSAYVTGTTSVIRVVHAFQPNPGGNGDAFVTKISPSGESLIYSTYLGGNGRDTGASIAVDSSGDAYIGGYIWFANLSAGLPTFPTTSNALHRSNSGGLSDGFITKLDPNGGLLYSTFFGGSGEDIIYGIAVDQFRTVYVAGYTNSSDLPQLASFAAPNPAGFQGFVATLVPSGVQGKSISYYSTSLGTSDPSSGPVNEILGIAIDKSLNAYVTGYTWTAFPVTKGAFHTVPRGQSDAFVSKLVIAADLGVAESASPATVASGSTLTYTLTMHNSGPDWAAYLTLRDAIPSGSTFVSFSGGGGACTTPTVGAAGTLTCTLPRLDNSATWKVQLKVNVKAAKGSALVNTPHIKSNMQDLVPKNNSATLTTAVD